MKRKQLGYIWRIKPNVNRHSMIESTFALEPYKLSMFTLQISTLFTKVGWEVQIRQVLAFHNNCTRGVWIEMRKMGLFDMYMYVNQESLPEESILPKTRRCRDAVFLSIFSSEHQNVPPVNDQQECLINGTFYLFYLLNSDNKAINCKK